MKKIFVLLMLSFMIKGYSQQFNIQSDFRFRFEQRAGYAALLSDSLQASTFIAQRARLIFNYSNEHIKIRISPQNVRVWGDVATLSKTDLNNAIHEGYCDVKLNHKFSLKIGRQEIVLDDHRIFGNVDWSMQGRSHDAALVSIVPDSGHIIQLGLAYNSLSETNFRNPYTINQYRSMQYAWYHGDFASGFGLSVLFLNHGLELLESGKFKIKYSQTAGSRISFAKKTWNIDATAYWQFGKININNVSAAYYSANVGKSLGRYLSLSAGIEYLSGKGQDDASTEIKSFNPLFGTNHKFNGHMDYFYVGNHINSVGLMDGYLRLGITKNKWSFKFEPHYFLAAADVVSNGVKQDNYLGTELDFNFQYKLYESVNLVGGISKMLATSTLETLRGGDKDASNYWAWFGVYLNPKLFSYQPNAQ